MIYTDPFGPEALASITAREQRTVIGHASIDLMSPMSGQTLDELVATIPTGARMLDMGCGKAALARHLLKKDPVASAVCIERNPVLAAQGEALARKNGVADRLQMIVADGREWKASETFDAIALLGATHAIGSLQEVLAYGATHLKAGGVVLLGEGVWAERPHADYLAFLGAEEDELMSREALAETVRKAGFRIRYEHLSSVAEWEAYETPYFQQLRNYADACGQHPFAEEASAFEAMQIKHGRKCMGFMVMAVAKSP
ncbi:SAM-dependent methyltransferase [Microvirga solisilvae]|uniref:SAM-dependent methyltransferase n=1 Tax=Microvirga solisilvae TaxID=2919498 RepID=UPI001FAF9117